MKRKGHLSFLSAGLLAITLVACGSDESSSDGTAAPATTVAAETSAAPTTPSTDGPATTEATDTTTAATEAATDTTDAATETSTADTDAAAGPVTIEHHYGSTEIEERPERIVSLDLQWTDVLLALGTTPVGYIADPNVPEGFPWHGDLLADATEMTATDTLPYEQIAALQPDLIVVTYFAQNEDDYEKLSAIAPTIPILSENQVDTWQDIAVAAGTVLDEDDAAQTLIDDVADAVAEVKAAIPGLDGKTFALASYAAGDGTYVVSDPADGSVVLFDELGLAITPSILAVADDATGRVKLSLEQTSLLDGDVLILFTAGADAETMPGYSALPAVLSGAVAVLNYGDVVGLNTPTPLSVPYSLDLIRPALEAAAAA